MGTARWLRRAADALGRLFTISLLVVATASGCSQGPNAPAVVSSKEALDGDWRVYEDPDSDSSITHYRIRPGQIEVRFSDGSSYLYTFESAGADTVKEMQALALAGDGLNSYIQTYVRDHYAIKSP